MQFTVMEGDYIFFGVIRPGCWDVEGGVNAPAVDGRCFDNTYYGRRHPGNHNWEGSQPARGQGDSQGDSIGMLLDLDQGSMTVWKNGIKLGVMVAEGLSGPYCWAVGLSVRRRQRVDRVSCAAR